MLVLTSKGGHGTTLVLGLVESDVQSMREKLTVTWEGNQILHIQNVIIMYGADKQNLIDQVRACGVDVSSSWEETYLKGNRTDRGAKM